MNRRRHVGLPATVLLGAVAVGVGYWGFREADPGLGASDAFYRAIQLLALEDAAVERAPWQLEFARYAAALALGLALITVLATFARERADRLRTRLTARGHHLIVGLGTRGRTVAAKLDREGASVVAIDGDTNGEGAAAARARDLPVIVGNARDAQTYRDAAASRAAHVFICLGDDSANLQALEACLEAVPDPGPNLHVAIDGHMLWRELHRSALTWGGHGGTIEFISLPDRVGTRLVEEAGDDLESGNLVVWGRGPKAVRTAAHAVRRVLLVGRRPRLVLAGPDADELQAELADAEPWVAQGADVEVSEVPADSGPGVAFLAGVPHADALAGASTLTRVLEAFTVVAEAPQLAGERALRRSGFPLDRVRLVDAEAQVLGSALFERSARELIARARHAYYVRQDLARGTTPDRNPSLLPWDELPDSLRVSNRLFADSIGERLADLGAELEPLSAPVRPVEMSAAVVEDLARVEHDRWMADLLAHGWRHHDGPKDPEGKVHPLLVEWEGLADAEREKDRDSIRALPGLLARLGYELRMNARPRVDGRSPDRH